MLFFQRDDRAMQTQRTELTPVKAKHNTSLMSRLVACIALWAAFATLGFAQEPTATKLKVLIVDGQNNHSVWPKTTEMMRKYLIDSGMFTVDLARTAPQGPDPNFKPDFSQYQLVVSNYNGDAWPEETQAALEKFMANGGGLVVVHAADNAFPEWSAWNEMIGLGGWGGRDARSGPYVYFDQAGKSVRDTADGGGGSHGSQHEFLIEARDSEHPIMQGVPAKWLHVQDELYDRLRGPAENMRVLATAFAAKEQGGSGRHEPQLMVVDYKQGRVFHTTLGHGDYSQECVGFITLFLRGAEWAATGKVTQKVPADFPTAEKVSKRKFEQ
jgi:type 1 glutamine amidotransferase